MRAKQTSQKTAKPQAEPAKSLSRSASASASVQGFTNVPPQHSQVNVLGSLIIEGRSKPLVGPFAERCGVVVEDMATDAITVRDVIRIEARQAAKQASNEEPIVASLTADVIAHCGTLEAIGL